MRFASVRPHSILFRLMMVFLLMILPVFGVGLSLYAWGVSLQDQQITRLLTQQIEARLRQLEARMEAVQTSILYLSSDPDTLAIAGMPYSMSDYERARELNDLQRQLWTLTLGDEIVNHISLYLPSVGKTVVSNVYAAGVSTISGMDEAEFEKLVEMGRNSANFATVADGSIFYVFQQPYGYLLSAGQRPKILFHVAYDVPAIATALSGVLENQRFAMFGAGGALQVSDEPDPTLRAALTEYAAGEGAQQFHGEGEAVDEAHVVSLGGKTYYTLAVKSRVPNAEMLFYVSRDLALNSLVDYRAWVWMLTGFLILAVVLYGRYAYRHVQTPVTLLATAFGRLELGETDFRVEYNRRDEFTYLVDRFNTTLQKLKSAISQLYDQKILTQQAQLKQLQAQINPHFLYNSFFILDNMILMEDYTAAAQFSRQLGQYFQFITRGARDMLPLSEEIRHARAYLSIQQIRYGPRLTLSFPDPPADWPDPAVPRLILQPILENAFLHALDSSEQPAELSVSFEREGGLLHIAIVNSGAVVPADAVEALRRSLDQDDPDREKSGMINVHQRLKITHGTGLAIGAPPEGGLRVTLTLKGD